MVSLIHMICPEGHKFCPFAIGEHRGCIPSYANCADAGAMRLLNGSSLEEDDPGRMAWLDLCLRSSDLWQCLLQQLASWGGIDGSMIPAFNQSCGANSTYCLARGRCVTPDESCHDVDFQDRCEPSQQYCASKFGCISSEEDCPPPFSPLAFKIIAILQRPGVNSFLLNYCSEPVDLVLYTFPSVVYSSFGNLPYNLQRECRWGSQRSR